MNLQNSIIENVRAALLEDVGYGDLTAQLVPADARAEAKVISREAAVLCGQAWFSETFKQVAPSAVVQWHAAEGDVMTVNQHIVTVTGNARELLSAERTALNFLQLLSGTATTVKQFALALQGTHTKIVDSRKTIPGLRLAQKYAVTVGGGYNHRFALYDGILIKENHIATAGGITAALKQAQAVKDAATQNPFARDAFVMVEVETLAQLHEALTAGATLILLDNMSHDMIREAVAMNMSFNDGKADLEVSGNVTLDNVRAYAELGVDRISSGSLTKHIRAVDYSMRMNRL
ncbi:carboxylating nicotinate-nucleotide diphosphorylase [Hydromonas duriensis]|uniref:Probable nicotinate-nucleotide pyrophosphorylase [carboxylating] n=1 Tax=Hydromonas duriensis TaxID=1527608 RepID=A0A4R6YA45_9BURK|nr:carboxylating nicotinate-nucleotide diphosphorylase [Hydromonas duriensis]TDR32391.1 nicotinate-nucleotide pyrophosphorylase [carboxylating] [Hydromonas duriensis]